METISKNSSQIGKTSVVIIFIIVIAVAIFFSTKNISHEQKTQLVFKEDVSVDSISDLRGLGYTGQRKIASDKDGNTYVTYRKDVNGHSEIFVARVSGEGENIKILGTEKPITVIESFEQRVPSIAIDNKGIIHIAWYGPDQDKELNNRQIKYSRSLDKGETWSEWKNIAYVDGFDSKQEYWQEHPFITVSRDGIVYVIWEGRDKNNQEQQIKMVKSTNGGGSWSNWKNIKEIAEKTQSRPSLVENQKGELFAFMYSSGGNNLKQQQIQVSMSKDKGETWSDWHPVSDPEFDSRHASSAIDSNGLIHVAWRSHNLETGKSEILYRSLNENDLSEIKAVSGTSGYHFFPSIGITESKGIKNIFVSWMESSEASNLPRENPQTGIGHIAFMKDGNFNKQKNWGEGQIFYPNVPEKWADLNSIPAVYLEQAEKEIFKVKIKYFNGIQ